MNEQEIIEIIENNKDKIKLKDIKFEDNYPARIELEVEGTDISLVIHKIGELFDAYYKGELVGKIYDDDIMDIWRFMNRIYDASGVVTPIREEIINTIKDIIKEGEVEELKLEKDEFYDKEFIKRCKCKSDKGQVEIETLNATFPVSDVFYNIKLNLDKIPTEFEYGIKLHLEKELTVGNRPEDNHLIPVVIEVKGKKKKFEIDLTSESSMWVYIGKEIRNFLRRSKEREALLQKAGIKTEEKITLKEIDTDDWIVKALSGQSLLGGPIIDLETGIPYYYLLTKLPKDVFKKLDFEYLEIETMEGDIEEGWFTAYPDKVEKIIKQEAEKRAVKQQRELAEGRKKELEILRKKSKEEIKILEETKSQIKEILNEIKKEFENAELPPKRDEYLQGEYIDNPFHPPTPYGTGESFVIEKGNKFIWHLTYYGMDSDDWSSNNLPNGVGRRVPYSDELANKLRKLKELSTKLDNIKKGKEVININIKNNVNKDDNTPSNS